ncbi:MAG: PDZ domain-containing protein [Gemmatimonadaceae bacterium]
MLRIRSRVALVAAMIPALAVSVAAQRQDGSMYRDPSGRFALSVPQGWNAVPQGQGVVVTNGTAMVVVSPMKPASGQEIVGYVSQQYAQQWQNFQSANKGDFQLSGQPAAYAMFTGTNPKGVAALLRIAGVSAGGQGYALIISAPRNEFNSVAPTLQSIETSFTLGGGGSATGPRGGSTTPRFPDQEPAPAPAERGGPPSGDRVTLGVAARDVEQQDLQQLGLRETRGALVGQIQPGSPAEAAGIAPGDVILTIDKQSVMHVADLRRILDEHRPGDQVEITFYRQGQVQQVRVRFPGRRSGSLVPTSMERAPGVPGARFASDDGGVPNEWAGDEAPGNYYRMKWVPLLDRHGFGEPVEVARFLIPADWTFEGGVEWGPATGCTANLVRVSGHASSPDGSSSFEFFTPYTWQWHDDPMNQASGRQSMQLQPALRPCDMSQPVGAADFIQNGVIPRFRRGAQVVRVEPLPQVAQAQQAMLQSQNAQMIQAGAVKGVRVDAAKVVLAYQVGGQPVEEWITGTVEIIAHPAYSASAAMNGGMAQVQSYNITAGNLTAMRAPAGELERRSKLYATIVGSTRPNLQWIVAAQQILAGIGSAQQQGAMDRAAIWRKAQGEISESIVAQYNAQQAVQDRLAGQYSQSVRGRETFIDPSSHERVELTAGYNQAWSNGKGEYILSDDPNFDPTKDLHETWTELRRPR